MDPRDGGETKSSLPLLTTYRPLPFIVAVQPGNLNGPHCCPGYERRSGSSRLGHWSRSPGSQTRTAADALQQSVELAMAAEELGADGAYFRRQIIRKPREGERLIGTGQGLLKVFSRWHLPC